MGLKVAACLGPKFDCKILKKVKKDYKVDMEACVELGFLARLSPSEYGWSHDEVRRAAFDLIPESKRESFPLLLGTKLIMGSTPAEMKDHGLMFVVADNMNRGSRMIEDDGQRVEVSQLNLAAGEGALSKSQFCSAAGYLTAGLSLLGSTKADHWQENYGLAVNLHDAASEALFVVGDFAGLSSLAEELLARARSFEDKLNVYNNLVRSLAGGHSSSRRRVPAQHFFLDPQTINSP